MIPHAEFLGMTPAELRPWIILAALIMALALLVVILARLRRIQAKPLVACVILSFVAHGLILFGLILFRLLEFPESPGTASILMHFEDSAQVDWQVVEPVADAVSEPSLPSPIPTAAPENPTEDPSAEDLSLAAIVSDPSEVKQETTETVSTDVARTEVQEAPPTELSSSSPESPETTEPLREDAIRDESTVSDDLLAAPPTETPPVESAVEPEQVTDNHRAVDNPANSEGSWQPASPPPVTLKAFDHRAVHVRSQISARFGGNERTEQAVRAGLNWLSRHQATHGGWNASQYAAGRGGIIDGQERGVCGIRADTGVTGLALLAFLASGSTQVDGEYSSPVQRGLAYLVHQQDSTGSLAGEADHFAAMYCHGIATLAMSEAYAMTADDQLVVPLQRALNYTVTSQHPETGGWRYRPGDDGDTSQFGWQALALQSGKLAGFGIPKTSFQRMERFLERVSQGPNRGLAAYRPERQATPTMTAEALVCRLAIGKLQRPALDEATDFLLDNPPGRLPANFYYNYYGALALHLSGVSWEEWNRAMQQELLGLQLSSGDMAGSWNPDRIWGQCGGRVFSTATATLCLEVYYRYLPLVNRNLSARKE